LSLSRSFTEYHFPELPQPSATLSANKDYSVLTDRKPRIVDLCPLNTEKSNCMGWLESGDSLILPPLQCPASRIEDFLYLGDLIKIATEDSFAYRKLKDAVDENNTWKTAYDDGSVKEEIVDIKIDDHFANLCKFYWIEHPTCFYDLIRHLETFRGGWRGDASRALINYKAQLYGYFGEPIDDAEDTGDDDEMDEDDEGSLLSEEEEGSGGDTEVPTVQDLLKMKSHYVDRVVSILHLADNSAPDFRSFSPPQMESIIKLLVWGGRFEIAVELLVQTDRHDDLVLLLTKMHSFVESSQGDSELKEPVRIGLERCASRALSALSGSSHQEAVLRLTALCDVVKTESMAL
jgi:hypothetical protein